jgi:hypothetical protein
MPKDDATLGLVTMSLAALAAGLACADGGSDVADTGAGGAASASASATSTAATGSGTTGAAGSVGSGGGSATTGAGAAGGAAGSGGTTTGGTGGSGATSTGGAGGTGGSLDTESSWTIVSPGDVVRATVELADKGGVSGYPAGVRLYYTVQTGGPTAYATVLEDSPLGITRADQDFVDGLSLETAGAATVVDETYPMLTGKRSSIRNHANERVLAFNAGVGRLELGLRAYDGGFAFRYRFPETSSAEYTVTGETTGFKLPAGSRGWLLPYDVAGTYTPAYENYWQNDVAVGTESPTAPGWCFPALFRTPSDQWLLLADTDVNGSYFAAHLARTAPDNVYRVAMPLMNEANSEGEVNPTSALPWATAWRMVIAGSSLSPVVESTMPTDLAAPSVVTDTSWIRPGRASWSWWTNDGYPTNYGQNTPYVDLAQTMTWEYSLIDHGWHQMGSGGTWEDLVSYAEARNVGLMVWYNSGGTHNSVSLTPRDRMRDAATRRSELESISGAGIKGIKVDFFHADKPWMMQYYLDILRDAADFQLLVNFHGSTLPRGWQRTYPNLMTAEAVRGAEWYKFDSSYAADQPVRNTILPFTRNVMASMDFTPVTFTNHTYPHLTTYAHELALSVVFESGLQHFADRVSGYTGLPTGPREFLQQVPSTWDDTRFVEGLPGEWVVLARRRDTTWYLGGIAGDNQARELSLSLAFLGAGSYDATVISDGNSDTSFSESSASLSAADSLSVSLRARGGFVARFTPG